MNKSILLIITLCSIFIFGCSSDEDQIQQSEESRYYVKYEVYMPLGSGFESSTTREIKFVTEKGEETITTSNESWEGIYGPLKKNTELHLSVKAKVEG